MSPPASRDRPRVSRRLSPFGGDGALWAATLLLCFVSLIALSSAAATLDPSLIGKQAVWIGLGMLAGILVASVSYLRWMEAGAFLYLGALALLAVVELAGTVKLGAARWLTVFGFSVQPSEIAKLATACVVARYLSEQAAPLSARAVLASGALAGLPAVLVFLQPDLGTSSVILAIWASMLWVAGLSRRHLAILAGAGLAALPAGWLLLKDYQRARLSVFINPHADPLGAGYTIIQSQIAVGSGRLTGRGWLTGTQNQLNFLPERHADFLYSVIGEEWGFLGAAAVVLLFGCLVWRGVRLAVGHVDPQGRLLAVGLTTWIAYQAMINMGMVMGLVPVVGVPLPLVSYGGSAMVMTWVAIGLLQSTKKS